jgi:hypothetical protein
MGSGPTTLLCATTCAASGAGLPWGHKRDLVPFNFVQDMFVHQSGDSARAVLGGMMAVAGLQGFVSTPAGDLEALSMRPPWLSGTSENVGERPE